MNFRRRPLIVGGMALMVAPVNAITQASDRVFRIGALYPFPNGQSGASALSMSGDPLQDGLREHGWMVGKNLLIESRFAGMNPQRLREAAAELKALGVALIIATGTTAIRAARDGAPGVPIVMIAAGDPVGSGFVSSLARPGGDLTGTSSAGEEVLGKQLELLLAAVSQLKKVTVLMNRANPANSFFFGAISSRATKLGLQLERVEVETEGELDRVIVRAQGGALLVVGDPMFSLHLARIVEATIRHRVPAVFNSRVWVAAGGLMSYLSPDAWHWRAAAGYIDKILTGAKPANLPVEQPTTFEFTINMKTAKMLGIAIPQSLLLRADEVIQ